MQVRRVQKVLKDAVVVPLVLNIDDVFHFKNKASPWEAAARAKSLR